MSKKVLVNLNMSKNQIENAAAHNLSSAPSNPAVGQEYFNTSDKQKYIWTGTAWVSETAQGTTYTEGTGIDIAGNVISANFDAVATAAQGALADTALQPDDNISELTNDAGYITNSALSGYVPTSRTVNGKALSANIELSASDVSALPSSTTINDLTTTAQQNALDSGATTTNIAQIGTIQSTISGYGNIVTHNTSEFATATQGTKADSAAQTYTTTNPSLTQTGGVCTWTVTHNLGANVIASVYDATTNEEVIVTIEKTSSTVATIKINSTANITSGAYRVVVIGK